MGRPKNSIILTKPMRKRILAGYKLALPKVAIAKYGGISVDTLDRWLKKGEADTKQTKQRLFYMAVCKAQGEHAMMCLTQLEKAANDGSVKAITWKLERMYPEDFGRRDQIEIYGKDGKPLEFVFPNLKNEETRSHYRELFGEPARAGEEHSESGPGGPRHVRN